MREHEDQMEAVPFLNKKSDSDSGRLSDDESTIIGQPEWKRAHHNDLSNLYVKKYANPIIAFLFMLLVFILTLLLWLLALQTSHHSSFPTKQTDTYQTLSKFQATTGIRSCGTTSQAALAAGCHFDTFSFAWTPPECTDLEVYNLSLSVLSAHLDFPSQPTFYTPTNDAIPFSALEDYANGVNVPGAGVTDHHDVVETWEHYLVGCAYGWQKVQRAAMRGWPLEEWSSRFGLARECGPRMLHREQRESGEAFQRLRPWFSKCGLEGEDMRREVAEALKM